MDLWTVWGTSWEDNVIPEGIVFAAFTKAECEDWIRRVLPHLEEAGNDVQWIDSNGSWSKVYCLVECIKPEQRHYQEAMLLLFNRL